MKEFSKYYLDNNKSERFLLQVHFFRSKEDSDKYDNFLNQLPPNPFIKKELLPIEGKQEVGYFTLHNDEYKILVLLPFISRKIIVKNEDTGFRDIISPYGFVGPLLNSGIDENTMSQFWHQVDHWYKDNNVVSEFIRFNFNDNCLGFTGSLVPTLKMVRGKIIAEPEQWENFGRKVRANIRTALSHKLSAKVYHKNITLNEIKEFYSIYKGTMDRHNAESRYRYSLDYFRSFICNNPDSCALICVYKQNVPISVELLLLSQKVVYSFLGGTDETHFYTRPNDFLKFEVISWARKNGFGYYFLGGGKTENDSLYRYKKKFFPKDSDVTFYTGRKVLNQKVYDDLVSKNPSSRNIFPTSFFPLYRYDY